MSAQQGHRNDGPAFKAADIGIAMGHTGTAVVREVADLTPADCKRIAFASEVLSGGRSGPTAMVWDAMG